jgi:hypothetical protein
MNLRIRVISRWPLDHFDLVTGIALGPTFMPIPGIGELVLLAQTLCGARLWVFGLGVVTSLLYLLFGTVQYSN